VIIGVGVPCGGLRAVPSALLGRRQILSAPGQSGSLAGWKPLLLAGKETEYAGLLNNGWAFMVCWFWLLWCTGCKISTIFQPLYT